MKNELARHLRSKMLVESIESALKECFLRKNVVYCSEIALRMTQISDKSSKESIIELLLDKGQLKLRRTK